MKPSQVDVINPLAQSAVNNDDEPNDPYSTFLTVSPVYCCATAPVFIIITNSLLIPLFLRHRPTPLPSAA